MPAHEPDENLLDTLKRRAADGSPEAAAADVQPVEPGEGDFDLVRRAMAAAEDPEAGHDATLGGYIRKHDRPPAFTGSDGQPYTVGVEAEPADAPEHGWSGYLVFLRWAATGAGIMEHLDSGDLVHGATEEQCRDAVLALSLYEVKAELDAALDRRRATAED